MHMYKYELFLDYTPPEQKNSEITRAFLGQFGIAYIDSKIGFLELHSSEHI
jgi:hypothetical protein